MKFSVIALLLSLPIIGIAAAATQQKTVQTVITCQQPDGDQWIEVGITKSPSGSRALVVAHDTDDNSAVLIANRKVAVSREGEKTIYRDFDQTIRLEVTSSEDEKTGRFSMLQDGPGSISQLPVDCYDNSSLEFQTK